MTPFEVLYRWPPPTITHYIQGIVDSPLVDEYLRDRDATLNLLKQNLLRAQAKMKAQVDKHCQDCVLAKGDWVYVRLQPFRQNSIRLQRHHNLG